MITIHKLNDVSLFLEADDTGDLLALDEAFKFHPSGFQFMPAFKTGRWDGWLHLFEMSRRAFPVGLYNHLIEFCESDGIAYEIGEGIDEIFDSGDEFDVSRYPIMIDGEAAEPYDYQESAVVHFVKSNRGICHSPTGSGKSLIIYLLIRHWLDSHDKKVLLIVPNVSLVNQMRSDILSYAAGDTTFSEEDIHIIKGGTKKRGDGRLYVATWQSLNKIDEEDYYEQFGSVLVDEAHLAKGAVISSILSQLEECPHRVGLTGTLSADESKVTELQLTGLFGPVYKTITTRELIDNGNIADMRIESLLLNYSDEDKQKCKKLTIQQEVEWLTTHPKRNYFLAKLTSLQKGNTIILFNFIKHGKDLLERIQEMCPERPVYFISGEVGGDEREEIRLAMEDHDDAIIVGNTSVIGTGISIKKLHSMILAHPTKSRIRTLQAVGRMLRKHSTKDKAVVYDISDDLQWKKRVNYGLKHFKTRIKYYAQEKLDYTMKKLRIG